MYALPYYKEKNHQLIIEFINQHPFAFLAGCDKNKFPVATQIPVFIEEKNGKMFLSGHMMRNTDHHKAFVENENVLAVFTGPHTYVSATWYSNPHIASTWNYMSVHVRGVIRFLDENGLKQILQKTSLHFENYNEKSTTVFQNLSDDYTHKLLHAIVGFEIEVQEIDHVFKLSQDRDKKSFDQIIEQLNQKGESEKYIASEMVKRKKDVFPDQ